VDGVLHSHYATKDEQFKPSCMRYLKRIVDRTGCDVVLSSSWRRSEARLRTVNAELERRDLAPVVDCTRMSQDLERSEDILAWLSMNDVKHWVAIDDTNLNQLGKHFFKTNCIEGLTRKNAVNVINSLNVTQPYGHSRPSSMMR